MLTDDELLALANDLESARVERKRSFKSDKSKIEEAICAFANDMPGEGKVGVILIGVDDRSFAPVGLTVTDELLLAITSVRSDGNILPLPTMNVRKAQLDGQDIVVIEVTPSHEPPVRLRGVIRVRVGPRRDIATRDEERVLIERRRGWDLPFDQRPIYGASLEDLDLDLFRREYLPSAVDRAWIAENGRSVEAQLASLHLASPDGVPTVTGMLTLGFNPTTWLKGAYVQFVRFAGRELSDPVLDRKEIQGPVAGVLRRMDEVTSAHQRVATTIVGRVTEERSPDYPMAAMQQLLRNAVMHREYQVSNAPTQWYWFSDRIEIHNPGGLFGRANAQNLGRPASNDYRNPTLAAVLRNLGFVQQFGAGIAIATSACRHNGNPDPEFAPQLSSFGVIIRGKL